MAIAIGTAFPRKHGARAEGGNGEARRLASVGPCVENAPIIENARKRLREAVESFELAEKAVPEKPEAGYLVTEQRRLARGILSTGVIHNAVIVLNEDRNDAIARQALQLVSEHGVGGEVRMAAKILLDS